VSRAGSRSATRSQVRNDAFLSQLIRGSSKVLRRRRHHMPPQATTSDAASHVSIGHCSGDVLRRQGCARTCELRPHPPAPRAAPRLRAGARSERTPPAPIGCRCIDAPAAQGAGAQRARHMSAR
jgi:hypothetical protein